MTDVRKTIKIAIFKSELAVAIHLRRVNHQNSNRKGTILGVQSIDMDHFGYTSTYCFETVCGLSDQIGVIGTFPKESFRPRCLEQL